MEHYLPRELQDALFKGFVEPTNALFPVMPQWVLRVNGRKFAEYLKIAKKKPRRSLLYLPIMDPLSRAATLWGYIAMATDMTYTAFIVPLSLAFNDYLQLQVYTILDFIGSSIYLLDLILEFHIGFMVKWDQETVTITDGLQVAKYYVTKSTFWIDFLAVLPIVGQIILAVAGNKNSQLVQLILVAKLLRLFRVLKMLRTMGQMDQSGGLFSFMSSRVSAMRIFVLHAGMSMFMLINLLACLWWWLAVVEGLDNSWVAYMDKPEVDLTTSNDSTRWLFSAYYVLCTIATVGYGDITPQTTSEVAFSVVFIICGVLYFGYLITTISAVMQSTSAVNAQGGALMDKMQQIEDWMRRSGFPKTLCRDVRKYYFTTWAPTYSGDEAFFSDLPKWLRIKASKSLLEQSPSLTALLGENTVLTVFDKNHLLRLLGASSVPERFPAGRRIYNAGETARYMYFVEEGELAVLFPGQRESMRISAPAVIGIGAIFAHDVEACRTTAAAVFTVTNCMLWKIDCEALSQALALVAPPVLLAIMKQYKRNVRKTHEQFAAEKSCEKSRQRVDKIYKDTMDGLSSFEVRLEQMVEDSVATGAGTVVPPEGVHQGVEGLEVGEREEDYITPFSQNENDEEAVGETGQRLMFEANMNRRQVDMSAQEGNGESRVSEMKVLATENGVNYVC